MRLGCPILVNRTPKTFFILYLSDSGESDIRGEAERANFRNCP